MPPERLTPAQRAERLVPRSASKLKCSAVLFAKMPCQCHNCQSARITAAIEEAVAAERERCATEAEELADVIDRGMLFASDVAAAIRGES